MDQSGIIKEYTWWFSTMEFSLDVLSLVCSSGKQLIKAELIEKGSRISLPIGAFDGRVISNPMHELEEQWQHLLFSPIVN